MQKENIAMCGLDCDSCPMFIATKNNDDRLREETAKEWSERYKAKGFSRPPLKPEDINCYGCLSQTGLLFLYCRKCEVRLCGLKKGVRNCGECEEYRCDALIKLHNRTTSGKGVCDRIRDSRKTDGETQT